MSRLNEAGISWVILGQQTPVRAKTTPKIEWIREIVEAADNAGLPVFLKDNLKPLVMDSENHKFHTFNYDTGKFELRQEFPKESA